MTRPPRSRKSDTLVYPGATAAEIRCDLATAPFDRDVRAADAQWGQDRLPELVSPQTAERWGLAMANLNAAITAQDPELVAARVAACVRGIAALDAEARAAGHVPTPPEAWRLTVDGRDCAIIRDGGDWTALQASLPGVRLYSLHEVSLALAHYGGIVAAIKDSFPGTEIAAVRKPTALEEELEDEIVF